MDYPTFSRNGITYRLTKYDLESCSVMKDGKELKIDSFMIRGDAGHFDEYGNRMHPTRDTITEFDPIYGRSQHSYIMINKPRGCGVTEEYAIESLRRTPDIYERYFMADFIIPKDYADFAKPPMKPVSFLSMDSEDDRYSTIKSIMTHAGPYKVVMVAEDLKPIELSHVKPNCDFCPKPRIAYLYWLQKSVCRTHLEAAF